MWVSTLAPDAPFVGLIGTTIGTYNKVYFGYLAYIFPLMIIGFTWFLYKNPSFTLTRISVLFPLFLVILSLLVFQAHVVDSYYYGALGGFVVTFLKSYIGNAGIWIFIITALTLGMILLSEVLDFSLSKMFNLYELKDRLRAKIDHFLYKENDEEFVFADSYSVEPASSQNYIPTPKVVSENIKHQSRQPSSESADTLELPNSLDSLLQTPTVINESKPTEHMYEEQIDSIKQESSSLASHQPQEPDTVQISQPVTVVKELEENTKLLKEIKQGKTAKPKNFKLPYFDFLKSPPVKKSNVNEHEIDEKIQNLLEKLKQFKIEGDVVRTYSGPVVTTFEFRPAAHIKVSKILTLQDDLAMALKAQTIRIQAPVPGKDVVGIEIPNKQIETIYLKEILQTDLFQKAASPLTMVVGKDIVGNPFVTDLTKLPHLLIAGTTGSGKSVGINAMLVSLLYRNSPDDLKLLMIDPKMLEFSIYNDIPHLLTPVITQAKQAILALANMVVEMERRYKMMSKTKTKNIENYNEKAKKEGFDTFPYIVVIIDELADLMMTSGKDVEFYIARLAQMARASGIHLIVATQRPSVDVVTGLIKANLPSRISFRVGQKIDSKVILDATGADSLLGRGDMLFTPPGSSGLIRLHAPFVTEKEIETIVEFLKVQREVVYDPTFLSEPSGAAIADSAIKMGDTSSSGDDFDELYEEAKQVVLTDKKTSISYLQRKLQIGYNRSARIIEQLEMMGVISAPNAKGNREILE